MFLYLIHMFVREGRKYMWYIYALRKINLILLYMYVIHLQLKPYKVLYQNSKAVERMMKYVTSFDVRSPPM
jgi:hypothetical protein